jgi:hypothetical protein
LSKIGVTVTEPASTDMVLHKAVTPQQVSAYLNAGHDRVGGYVLRAVDAIPAKTPADLIQAHALSFPGSPYSAERSVHTLWFRATSQLNLESAVGGNDKAGADRTGGSFIDHPPFTGTGLAPWRGHVAPVYWLRHSRIPAGAELHRTDPDGTRNHVATYVDVATGWQAAPGLAPLAMPDVSPKVVPLVGPTAVFRGVNYAADPLGDGSVVLSSPSPVDGFEPTELGRFRRIVPMGDLDDLFEMLWRGRVRGLPVRLVDVVPGEGGNPAYWVSYLEHVAPLAEGLGFTKVDAGLYETTAATTEIDDLETLQLTPTSWSELGRETGRSDGH